MAPAGTRSVLLAPVFPGVPHSFDDESAYLDVYRSSHWAVTHRKGGWDCFRHIEILFAGAMPLMPDAADVPSSAMVHYPRPALRELFERLVDGGPFTSRSAMAQLREHALRWLTSSAMARYLLRAVGYRGGRILFVDPSLPEQPDYLSMMTLIGLRRVVGSDVIEWRPTTYLYDDHEGDVRSLYGRGFGYARVLPAAMRGVPCGARTSSDDDLPAFIRHQRPALVVFGSVARAGDAPRRWRSLPDATRPPAAVVFGEDQGPDDAMLGMLRDLGATIFVRESEADLGRSIRSIA